MRASRTPANRRPSPLTLVVTFQMGGAINRVAPTESAYAEGSAPCMSSIDDNWEDPADGVANFAWVRESFGEIFALLERHDVHELYRAVRRILECADGHRVWANLERRQRIKAQYDTDNFFRLNPNVLPASPAVATSRTGDPLVV